VARHLWKFKGQHFLERCKEATKITVGLRKKLKRKKTAKEVDENEADNEDNL
jgi:hypothetical protein